MYQSCRVLSLTLSKQPCLNLNSIKSKPKKSRLGPIISPDVIGIERNVETKDGTKKIVEKVPGKPEEPKPEDKMTEGSGGKDENSDSKKVDTGANKRLVSKLIKILHIELILFEESCV